MNKRISRSILEPIQIEGETSPQRYYDLVEMPREEVDWIDAQARSRSLRRGDLFCKIDQTYHEIGFLRSGILVVYLFTPKGDKIVLDFQFPGEYALALNAASQGEASEVNIEAITACTFDVWPYELLEVALRRHVCWGELENLLLRFAFHRGRTRQLSLRTRNAQHRYACLDDEFPASWREIPQHLLAAYLHVTPQHLSRLKRAERARMAYRTAKSTA